MKKSDLKLFDIIELRSGKKFMLHEMEGEMFGVGSNSYFSLPNILEDLSHKAYHDLDIVKVYRPKDWKHQHVYKHWEEAPLIWERKEPIRLTREQYVQLSLFKGFDRWIVKNSDGNVFIYKEKPQKNDNTWVSSFSFIEINADFSFLSWDDKEPTSIDKLLENCEVVENETN